MLDKKTKERIIKKFRTHETDTGSTPIQVAILTEEIKILTNHLKKHKKDFSSRRGLLRKVAERKKLLTYLQKEDPSAYEKLVKALKLKVAKLLEDNREKESSKEKVLDEETAQGDAEEESVAALKEV